MFSIGAKLEEEPLEFQGAKAKKKESNRSELKPKNEHQLVFRYEKRNGKPVTIIGRFCIDEKDKKSLLKLLKTKLACGGKVDSEWIELQGDMKIKAKDVLQKEGWKFRK
jgi:translation initiation factor 1